MTVSKNRSCVKMRNYIENANVTGTRQSKNETSLEFLNNFLKINIEYIFHIYLVNRAGASPSPTINHP